MCSMSSCQTPGRGKRVRDKIKGIIMAAGCYWATVDHDFHVGANTLVLLNELCGCTCVHMCVGLKYTSSAFFGSSPSWFLRQASP